MPTRLLPTIRTGTSMSATSLVHFFPEHFDVRLDAGRWGLQVSRLDIPIGQLPRVHDIVDRLTGLPAGANVGHEIPYELGIHPNVRGGHHRGVVAGDHGVDVRYGGRLRNRVR